MGEVPPLDPPLFTPALAAPAAATLPPLFADELGVPSLLEHATTTNPNVHTPARPNMAPSYNNRDAARRYRTEMHIPDAGRRAKV
jgi:hypothetical protein